MFVWWFLCGGVCVWCFCGGAFVVFLWWCSCGGVFVVVFVWWCLCGGVFALVVVFFALVWLFPKAGAKGSFKKSVAIKDCH